MSQNSASTLPSTPAQTIPAGFTLAYFFQQWATLAQVINNHAQLINQLLTPVTPYTPPAPIQTDKTGTNAFNTVYTNSLSVGIWVSVCGNLNMGVGHNASAVAYTGPSSPSSVIAANSATNGPGYAGVTFFVMPGYEYEVKTHVGVDTDPLTLTSWIEWTNA